MEISDKEIIKKIFENRAEVIEGHDPWRYGSDLAELTDKVEIDWIMKNLPIDSSRLMLDVGCGTGRHVLELANHKKSLMIFGCDFIEKNIDFANSEKLRMGITNASFFCSSATDFAENSPVSKFDIITAIGLIQYLTTENELLEFTKNCARLMGDEAVLLLKHPLSFNETFVLDYHREEMDTRYISSYYNMNDLMGVFDDYFELLSSDRAFTEKNMGDVLQHIERDERAVQMWLLFSKKRKTV